MNSFKRIFWNHDLICSSGWLVQTYIIQSQYYLPYLMKQFRAAGGQVIQKRIKSFDEVWNYVGDHSRIIYMPCRTLIRIHVYTTWHVSNVYVIVTIFFKMTELDLLLTLISTTKPPLETILHISGFDWHNPKSWRIPLHQSSVEARQPV